MSDLVFDAGVRRGSFELDARFEAKPGVTVLFGPSGAGKSTVLDVVAGLARPSRGTVRLGDRTLDDASRGEHLPARSRRVGYVLQGLALFPHLSVIDNVTFGLVSFPRAKAVERARALLSRLGIDALASRLPGSLSGGERQRVALARAFAIDPAVLLLDEPFAALDRPRRRDLVTALRELVAERALPVLFVTHDQEEAEAIGERVVVLEDGRVAATGAPLDVLEAPSRWAAAGGDATENRLPVVVVARREREGALEVRSGELKFLTRPAELEPGAQAVLAIRAADVILSLDAPGRVSAANVLRGTVRAVEAVGRAVFVTIDCGVTLRAEVTPAAAERLGLVPGVELWAMAKARGCHVFARQGRRSP